MSRSATTTSSSPSGPATNPKRHGRTKRSAPATSRPTSCAFLRPYQLKAIHALQAAVKDGKDRFLFEMATGTGKTLTAAAVIKLFLRSGNARRVLFLVDRLELEDQAKKAFAALLAADFKTVILQGESRRLAARGDRCHHRPIASLQQQVPEALFADRFRPGDLRRSPPFHRRQRPRRVRLLHRLQARPHRHAPRLPAEVRPGQPDTRDPREAERRLLLDTYRTFGCENSQPTFRYSLLDGVKDGYPDQSHGGGCPHRRSPPSLLSEEGFVVDVQRRRRAKISRRPTSSASSRSDSFSEATNQLFCKTFLENALRDPVSGEIGKSIIFAVSQNHAAKLAQILNEMADTHVPRQVPVRLRRAGHLADPRRPAIHHQFHQ